MAKGTNETADIVTRGTKKGRKVKGKSFKGVRGVRSRRKGKR